MPKLLGTVSRRTAGAMGSIVDPFDRGGVPPPYVHFLDPADAVVGGPDVTLQVRGTFLEGNVIVFNGGEETTVFVDATTLTTIVKPSTASGPITVPVTVKRDDLVSRAVQFSFLPAPSEPLAPQPPTAPDSAGTTEDGVSPRRQVDG